MSIEEMYNALVHGLISLDQFEDWVYERERHVIDEYE